MLVECCGKRFQVWKQFVSVAFVHSSYGQVFDWIDKLQNRVRLLESLSVFRAYTFAEPMCCQSVSYLKSRRYCWLGAWMAKSSDDRLSLFIKEMFAWQGWYVCCDIKVNPIYLKALPFSGRLLLTGSEYTKSTVFSMFKVWCRVTPHFIFLFTSSAAEVIADWESIGNVQEFVSKVSLFSAAIAKTYKRRISSCRWMFSIVLPSYLIMACCKWANLCRKRYIHTGPCMSHALRSL